MTLHDVSRACHPMETVINGGARPMERWSKFARNRKLRQAMDRKVFDTMIPVG